MDPTEPINVVLIGLTGMLSQIVRGILAEPDVRVAAELSGNGGATNLDRAPEADVVILASDDHTLPRAARELLAARPRMKVLTIRDDGRETFLYELRPFQIQLGQVSPQTLLDAVRTTRTAPL